MAEAESWARLSQQNLRGEPEQKPDTGSNVRLDCLTIAV
jgi:hypothetical protein